jgi:DNA recombination protein RmuC
MIGTDSEGPVMPDLMPILSLAAALLAALFAALAFWRASRLQGAGDGLTRVIRDEADRSLKAGDEQARAARAELGDIVGRIDEKIAGIGRKLDVEIARMGSEAATNRDALRQAIELKLDDAGLKQQRATTELREGMGDSFRAMKAEVSETLNLMSAQQRERLETTNTTLKEMIDKHQHGQESLRQTVEGRLDAIRAENTAKLEEMRNTVDEKLQSTLETRLGESFNRVVEQLERVHKGIGEMQSLATNVGDLKNVLTNVKVRGTFGEVQLAMLLDEFLSPDQYARDVQTREGSTERVEYAIKMPGKGDGDNVWLPVDAKFPREDYERLLAASEAGDAALVAEHRKALETRIKACARDIRQKYINPPQTTDFAILFLPTEGLYAEALRQAGLFEFLQREYRVTLAGPTTLAALLNALQMGFRTLAIEQRSSEVWQVLAAVRTEFGKYNAVVERLGNQLNTAVKSVDSLGTRTRAMDRKLRTVEALPDAQVAENLLGITGEIHAAEDVDEADGDADTGNGAEPRPRLLA